MKRQQYGASVVEMLITSLVVALTLIAVFNLVVGAGRASASYELTSSLSRHSRTAIDEVLYQIRGGESVLSSTVVNGRRIYTSSTTAVVRLPAYHPNHSSLFLENSWDIVAFEYDAANRTLYETIVPATGSARPARTRYPIARNVRTARFTYNARQSYRAITLGVQACALGAPISVGVNAILGGSGSAAQVFVDGVPAEFNTLPGTNIVTTSAPLGATIQILYPVTPWIDNGASLAFVDSIGFSIAVEDPTTPRGSATLHGDSTLRNHAAPLPLLSQLLSGLL